MDMAVYITKHGLEILFQLLMNSIIFTTYNDKMPYIGTTVGTDDKHFDIIKIDIGLVA